ncbi:MAG: hypothetical protein ACRECX_09610 [Methyloceanibacter sp.]|uniref:hypothetical protein n=1 Tax=Methyloceanibacter sp. TaxID=1965321 RepID=UPI003D6D1C20
MISISRFIGGALLVGGLALVLGGNALAEPLNKDACASLESERRSLFTNDIKAALERGPDWVKDHLHTPEEIEKVRQYLLVEEKLAFRCRSDGVVMPKPQPVPLPDRKPDLPPTEVAATEAPKILADAASTSLLPLRKPSLADAEETVAADTGQDEVQEAGDSEGVTTSGTLEPGPSQTVADSDKRAPESIKATQ